jgi:phospho-N-acetylmuramoyl-pentapeptide-transferase
MFYYLFFEKLTEIFSLFNIFRYITFRAIYATVTALLIALVFGPSVIRRLQRLKIGQQIRDDGPQEHLSKAGTPTMGGLLIIIAVLISILLWARFDHPHILVLAFSLIWFGGLGFLDDYQKINKQQSLGLRGWHKIIFQTIGALAIACYFYYWGPVPQPVPKEALFSVELKSKGTTLPRDLPGFLRESFASHGITLSENVKTSIRVEGTRWRITDVEHNRKYTVKTEGNQLHVYPVTEKTSIIIPFFKRLRPNLGILFIPFAAFVIVCTSNAVNLTDGLDGLAIGCTLFVAATFGVLGYLTSHQGLANYLDIVHLPDGGEATTIFCAALIGAGLGFLWYNCHPAQVFMGDTGSLALGAAIGTVSLMVKEEILLVIVGGIFVAEALSVILQVWSFQTRGKRIFKMAPLHHHFEQLGWDESKVVIRFWIVALLLMLMALSTLKLR